MMCRATGSMKNFGYQMNVEAALQKKNFADKL